MKFISLTDLLHLFSLYLYLCIPVHNYYVEVYTKDESGAGTDASVHLTITGSKGNTGRRKLLKSHVDDDKFERGKVSNILLHLLTLALVAV